MAGSLEQYVRLLRDESLSPLNYGALELELFVANVAECVHQRDGEGAIDAAWARVSAEVTALAAPPTRRLWRTNATFLLGLLEQARRAPSTGLASELQLCGWVCASDLLAAPAGGACGWWALENDAGGTGLALDTLPPRCPLRLSPSAVDSVTASGAHGRGDALGVRAVATATDCSSLRLRTDWLGAAAAHL
jgi:hypothetical protein